MFSLFEKSSGTSIHVNELDQIQEEINLIDIREPYECAHGCHKKARNIPMGQLMASPNQYLEKSQKYYIVCQSGGRSSNVVSALQRAGYDVINVKGGMGSYTGRNMK